jgi:glycosyltransferase involved in cell wall biosynthesis
MSSKKIKALFLSSWFPTKTFPTKGNFVEKHLQAVSETCDTAILHIAPDHLLKKDIEVSLTKRGNIPYLIIYYRPSQINIPIISGIFKLVKFIKLYFKGYKIITKGFGKPDIIHANVLFPVGIIAYLFKKFKKIPYVITEHWTAYTPNDPTNIGSGQLFLSKIIAKNADFIMPVSDHLKVSMINFGLKSNYEVIPNVVNTEIFHPGSEQQQSTLKKILHVSTLVDEQKNFSGILNVLARLKKLRNDFELLVITDGDYQQYSKKVEELELKEVVKFSGLKTSEEIAEIMKESAFLLLFSNFENLPCVIVEAFAAGIPVVSTNVGGIKEHVDKSKGILINKGDEFALFEAINSMLDNKNSYIKSELADYAVANFSYNVVGKKYHDIYQKVLNK